MIITQTPLRISLFGGGTDFREFFLKEGGAVLSLGVDKYIYVIVKERFDDAICLNYSRKEITARVDEIQHDLVREALRKTGIEQGVEITTLADVPSEGSGLGSSSSVTVGLLNACYAYQGEQVPLERLAREACEIEIDILGKPIGIQDQYIAAYGNLRFLEFRRDGAVVVEKLVLPEERKRQLVSNLMVFYSGITRPSASVLTEQRQNIPDRMDQLRRLSDFAYQARECLLSDTSLDRVGHMLHQSWESKKTLASNVTNGEIDDLYGRARRAGCLGGKVVGAGSGGFVLLYCPKDKQEQVRDALRGYRELPVLLSRDGSKVIFNTRSYQ
ncbi:MAG: GHMP kinase [Methanobacteriota archaeon]|nr:MAG: GHMP kinase [Euryarchaeota archaeon]